MALVTVCICSKLKTSSKLVVFTNKVGKNSRYFVGVFNETIIQLALVGYEMIIANLYPTCTRGIIVNKFFTRDIRVNVPQLHTQKKTTEHTGEDI